MTTDDYQHPTCTQCQRIRYERFEDGLHPMDAYDYSPLQVITGQSVGWYSGDDGDMCPECMAEVLSR